MIVISQRSKREARTFGELARGEIVSLDQKRSSFRNVIENVSTLVYRVTLRHLQAFFSPRVAMKSDFGPVGDWSAGGSCSSPALV